MKSSLLLLSLVSWTLVASDRPLVCIYYESALVAPTPGPPGNPREKILTALKNDAEAKYAAGEASAAIDAMVSALARNGYQVKYSTYSLSSKDLANPERIQAIADSLHGGISPNYQRSGSYPHDVIVPRILVDKNGHSYSLDALAADGPSPDTQGVKVLLEKIFRIVHEETFHAAEYDGQERIASFSLPLTKRFIATQGGVVRSLEDQYDLPPYVYLGEIEYLEYQLTRDPAPFQTAEQFEEFMHKWSWARWAALKFFESQPEFEGKITPQMRQILAKAKAP